MFLLVYKIKYCIVVSSYCVYVPHCVSLSTVVLDSRDCSENVWVPKSVL